MSTEYPASQSSEAEPLPYPAENERFPKGWKEALPCLIASRLEIIRIEAQDVFRGMARSLILLGVAVFCMISAWLLLIGGVVGLLSEATGWTWYHAAFMVAGAHLIIAILIFLIINRSSKSAESFPITRVEFEKDREWLNQLKNQSSSEN